VDRPLAYDEAIAHSGTQLKQLYTTAYTDLKDGSIKSVSHSFHFIIVGSAEGF
jgi:hypothetical protein